MTRFFDIVLSFIAIIILLPLMIPIMIGLKLTGEHHVFYKQIRVGQNGREFGLLKFATMVENASSLPGGMHTLKNDPRMLPMGTFLRRTKINELPQLVNILIGDMSVIGYRPTDPHGYTRWPNFAKKKLYSAKPGLSGIGSIVFRNEDEILQNIQNCDEYYEINILPYKMELESWYQDNKSASMYWKLIYLTIDAVLRPSKSSWKRKLKSIPPIPETLRDVI